MRARARKRGAYRDRQPRRRDRGRDALCGVAPLWASIHIAGGFVAGPLRDMSAATLRQQIDMNLVSCALCCRAAVKAMTGGGRIVNVSARAGLEWRSGAGMVAYTASKAAVAALTAALAEEVAKDDILVNAVAPSIMDTPANRQAMPKADYALWPKVEEVAATIAFFGFAGKSRHPWRHRAGLRQVLKPIPTPGRFRATACVTSRDHRARGTMACCCA